MVYPSSPHLFLELERQIRERTGWRVRNLTIELARDPERAVVRGEATSALVCRTAQHVIHDFFPHVPVENGIVVDDATEILPGMPLN